MLLEISTLASQPGGSSARPDALEFEPVRIFVPDLQETVAMTVEQYYHTRVTWDPTKTTCRAVLFIEVLQSHWVIGRYQTLDEAARVRAAKSNMILSLVREMLRFA